MLSCHFSAMTKEQFTALPNTTNAVESHNRLSKTTHPEILKVAMLTTYKVDMSVTLEHMAKLAGMKTSYEDTNEERKLTRKRKFKSNQNDDGLPDKRQHFLLGMLLFKLT